MSIDNAQIAKLAKLSRLSFTEDKLAAFSKEFNNILGFVAQISEVDTQGIAPLTSVANLPTTPERQDAAAPKTDPATHQANAPQAQMGFYVVPKIVE